MEQFAPVGYNFNQFGITSYFDITTYVALATIVYVFYALVVYWDKSEREIAAGIVATMKLRAKFNDGFRKAVLGSTFNIAVVDYGFFYNAYQFAAKAILITNVTGGFPFIWLWVTAPYIPVAVATFIVGFSLVYLYKTLGFGTLGNFLPSGVPAPLVKFVVIIEGLAFFIKCVSLASRLVANVASGRLLSHMILAVVPYLLNAIVYSPLALFWTSSKIIFFILITMAYLMIYILEFLISILQSLVFAYLALQYIRLSFVNSEQHLNDWLKRYFNSV